MKKLGVVLAAVLLASCSKTSEPPPAASAAPPPEPAKPAPTRDDWKAAVNGTFQEQDRKPKGDGVEEFLACFSAWETLENPPKGTSKTRCAGAGPLAKGTRDGFRKITFFKPITAAWNEITGKTQNSPVLNAYVSLPDCTKPVLFLRAIYTGDNWLFLERVSVLVDGELVLDRDLSRDEVSRETDPPWGVFEKVDFKPTEAEQAALARITDGKEVLIRMTGKRGYVPVKAKFLPDTKKVIGDALAMHSRLGKAAEEKLPPGGCG